MTRLACLLCVVLLTGCGDDSGPGSDGGGDGRVQGCAPGEELCGSICSNTMADARNCGGCGNACSGGAFCDMGACRTTCSSGLTACGASCVDVATDRAHCGRCDAPCASDETCRGGACGCPDGYTRCGGACLDPDTDRNNCGVCGRSCGSDQVCRGGTCTCPAGERETDCADGVDDDCDSMVDCADPDCEGATRPCVVMTCAGVETCQAGGTWGTCAGGALGAEICGDGIDQDCDGSDLRMPDMYEPNDTCAQCTLVTTDVDPMVTVRGRFDSVADGVDCYQFVTDDLGGLSAIEHIRVGLTGVPVGHDYDIYLYRGYDNCEARNDDPGGRSVALGNADEMIDWAESFWPSEDGGNWYVRVVRWRGHSCTDDYTLTFDGLR